MSTTARLRSDVLPLDLSASRCRIVEPGEAYIFSRQSKIVTSVYTDSVRSNYAISVGGKNWAALAHVDTSTQLDSVRSIFEVLERKREITTDLDVAVLGGRVDSDISIKLGRDLIGILSCYSFLRLHLKHMRTSNKIDLVASKIYSRCVRTQTPCVSENGRPLDVGRVILRGIEGLLYSEDYIDNLKNKVETDKALTISEAPKKSIVLKLCADEPDKPISAGLNLDPRRESDEILEKNEEDSDGNLSSVSIAKRKRKSDIEPDNDDKYDHTCRDIGPGEAYIFSNSSSLVKSVKTDHVTGNYAVTVCGKNWFSLAHFDSSTRVSSIKNIFNFLTQKQEILTDLDVGVWGGRVDCDISIKLGRKLMQELSRYSFGRLDLKQMHTFAKTHLTASKINSTVVDKPKVVASKKARSHYIKSVTVHSKNLPVTYKYTDGVKTDMGQKTSAATKKSILIKFCADESFNPISDGLDLEPRRDNKKVPEDDESSDDEMCGYFGLTPKKKIGIQPANNDKNEARDSNSNSFAKRKRDRSGETENH